MLKGISPLLSPEFLANLCAMGHGDTLVLGDTHFPGEAMNPNCLRADGLKITDLLHAILPLIDLDAYVESPLIMMDAVKGDHLDPATEENYMVPIREHAPTAPAITRVDRFQFYDLARDAFVVVMTGETAAYGNILITKQ